LPEGIEEIPARAEFVELDLYGDEAFRYLLHPFVAPVLQWRRDGLTDQLGAELPTQGTS
jgi:hypothetical protein